MRVWMVGVIMSSMMIASTARADFKVEPGLLPQAAPKVAPAGVLPPVSKESALRTPEVNKDSVKEADAADGAKKSEEPKPVPTWTLVAGHTIGKELQAWGEKAGWKVIWNLSKDWAIPASTAYKGEFKDAVSSVIKNLATNGALIRAQFYDGNKTLVVNGPGQASQ